MMKKNLRLAIVLLLAVVVLAGCGVQITEALTPETAGPFQRIFVLPLITFITWLYELVGNLGVAIIIGTVIVKLAVMPLMLKSMNSTAKMQELNPEIEKIKKKYANKTDRESQARMQQETMALWKEHGVNPMAGCLPMLIQMPLLIGFFQAFSRHPLIVEAAQGITEVYFLGMDVAGVQEIPNYVFGVLVAGLMYMTQKRSQARMQGKTNPDGTAAPNPMASMNLPLSLMIGWMVVTSPLAMGLYFLVSQIMMNLQSFLIKKPATPAL